MYQLQMVAICVCQPGIYVCPSWQLQQPAWYLCVPFMAAPATNLVSMCALHDSSQ